MIPKTLLVGLTVIFLAYLYARWNNDTDYRDLDEIERKVISSWASYIKPPSKKFQRVAVGINSNLDLIVPGIELLTALKLSPSGAKNNDVLSSLSDLQETFAYFFSKGSAAERLFQDAEVYKQIVAVAEQNPKKEHYVGGNAALMATKVSELFPDAQIQYVGPVGPTLQGLMPDSITIPANSRIDTDEVHLIMEYKVGEKWGDHVAPVATRFITSYDESNSKVSMLETFFSSFDTFQPDLILMSGLHLLEGQSQEFFSQRLKAAKEGLKAIANSIPVHLELASMANGEFVKQVIEEVLSWPSSLGLNEQELGYISLLRNGPHSDLIPALSLKKVTSDVNSLGLNEQELSFASETAGGPHADSTNGNGQPDIHKISDILLWLLKTFGYSQKNTASKLTRVHFHSLTFHILATVKGSWKNNEAAVAAGARIAGRQACNVKALSVEEVEIKIPKTFKLFTGDVDRDFDEKRPVYSWDRDGIHFVFTPVLVCSNPQKTVGLGDAISATGLMYSEFITNASH